MKGLMNVLPLFCCIVGTLKSGEANATCNVETLEILPPPGREVYMNFESSGVCTFGDVAIGIESVSDTPPPTITGFDEDHKLPFTTSAMSATLYYYPGAQRTITHCVDTTWMQTFYDQTTVIDGDPFVTWEYPEPELCYVPG